MIITCNNCNKNFNAESSLIPENGRLVQCNSCDHKWYFKKETKVKSVPIDKIKDIFEDPETLKEVKTSVEKENIDLLDTATDDVPIIEKTSIQNSYEKEDISRVNKNPNIKISKNKKNYNILGLTIVFIISFIAIIIVLDTFQKPISIFVPNIEFILYSLYETINDIVLFFNDLI